MSNIREGDLDRITIKIHNMKRSNSRDSPRLKRRTSIGRYDDSSDERASPERVRRRVARSPSPRYMSPIPHREEYARVPVERPSYKVLCISALHHKASDEFIKETLYREYKKFGDFSIRISHELDERVAYVCFRAAEDAREAKHHKSRIVLYDKVALVQPVYESASRSRMRSVSPPPPAYERAYYSRSPGPPISERRRAPVPVEYHEHYEPPPPTIIRPHYPRAFRPEYIPRGHVDYIPRGHQIRHHGPPHLHPGPRHYMPRHIVPRAPAPHHVIPAPAPVVVTSPENKKDKFPNYLHHVQPEDDPLATRTLFAGNLEINISDEELRRIFGKYGIVEDIDIKRPPPGTGNAFAFVKYQNLDMAHRAKVELSGQYIGKFQCKIGYGKATPTTRIWIGGLGAWTSVTQLEREFDRFGAIKKIEYQKGDSSAYIMYESIEAAAAAMKEMRGFALGGPEKRLRIDFADIPGAPPTPIKAVRAGSEFDDAVPSYSKPEYEYHEPNHYEEIPAPYPTTTYMPRGGYRGRNYRGRGIMYRGGYNPHMHHPHVHPHPHSHAIRYPGAPNDEWRRPTHEMIEYRSRRSLSREPVVERSRSRSPRRRTPESDSDSSIRRNGVLSSARTLSEIARKCNKIWQGALILKSSLFPAKFHLTDGDIDIIDSLMKDEDGKQHLRITQRLRLDLPKLEDVQKRILSSPSHAIFLGLAASASSIVQLDDAGIQIRPLRNLVSYLKQKEAAGVISLLNKDTEATGVLYIFPPCSFSTELLKRTCNSVSDESLKEDHLIVVVVRGGAA